MSLNKTPNANRLHIGIFGKRNAGKSSLINAITGQEIAIVSCISGTTTDPVQKAIEINGVGPCVIIDTAGFDDFGELGEMRVKKTEKLLGKIDIAILVFSDADVSCEAKWVAKIKEKKIPLIPVVGKADILKNTDEIKNAAETLCDCEALVISAKSGEAVGKIREKIISLLPSLSAAGSITGHLVKSGDVVLLVMPQDIQAPQGRLILPQVQTIRDLLDNKCVVTSCTTDQLPRALEALSRPPALIITDSQAFIEVHKLKPKESKLTSFSILFAAHKGDLTEFLNGAKQIDKLSENSSVLIAEACTHAPLEEDIGREKIPRLLRKKIGKNLKIDIVSGADFPEDLSAYDLIIHCGACMFSKKHILSRIQQAQMQNVPITNYGVALAKLSGVFNILDNGLIQGI